MKRHLITAALPYANGPLHIGHIAGCYLPSDIYARFLRNMGEEVLFICGTDEHGVAITMRARKEGITPQEVVDKYYEQISSSFERFGISFDHFSRTSRPVHHKTAQEFFTRLYDKGLFEEIETEQYFDEEAQQFLADRYITGTCPVCSNDNAYGDQCEKCGSALSPTDLKNPRSALSGTHPVLKKAKNWFLPMDKIAQTPEFAAYSKRVEAWRGTVKGQFSSWIKEGLHPRAMTRDLDWGIPVPVPGAEGKVLYVWFDAPIGYISATKEYAEQKGEPEAWKKWWTDNDTSLVHFIGKDNIVFHTIIFPMMLMEHGGFILPDQVPANEFLNLEGQKLSTSRNWAVWLHEYLDDFSGRNDELRYTLTSIAPETKDSDFTWKDYQLKVDSELVAILGNFVNRVMVLCHKYFDGTIPEMVGEPSGEVRTRLEHLRKESDMLRDRVYKLLREFKFREAQAEWINLSREGNDFLAKTEPWKLWKTDPDSTRIILLEALNLCVRIAAVGEPFLPETARKIMKQLNVNSHDWNRLAANWNHFDGGHKLGEAFLLFSKVEDEAIAIQTERLSKTLDLQAVAVEEKIIPAEKSSIQYEDFAKMDIRVGTIREAVKVPKADKLLQLTIDTGLDVRTVVSGIAGHYSPEEIIGRQVCVLVNLAPRKLRGIESQGMILMAESEGKLLFVQPGSPASPGSTVS